MIELLLSLHRCGMRRTKYNTIILVGILFIVVLLPSQCAEESQLSFALYDEDGNIPTTFTLFVGTNYNLYVTATDLNDPLTNVTVTFPWGTNITTSKEPILPITSLQYQLYAPTFTISAAKEGYLTVQKTFLVSNQKLSLDLPSTIKEQNSFTITVYDEEGNTLKSATILFSDGTDVLYEQTTDSKGQVKITAPIVNETTQFSVSATKTGYQPVTTSISITNRIADEGNQLVSFFIEMGPILFSIISVILAVGFVEYRNRQKNRREPQTNLQPFKPKKPDFKKPKPSIQKKQKTPPSPPPIKKEHTPIKPSQKTSHPHRIEEIHIHQSRQPNASQQKPPKQKNNQTNSQQNKEQSFWVEGDDQLHRKIDQLINDNNKKKQKAKHHIPSNTSR